MTSRKLNVMITAGATREPLDPVRFISNNSSGLTGCLLASAAARDGARVTLVTGVTGVKPPAGKIKVIKTATAREMHRQVMKYLAGTDIFISNAAVSDYRPRRFSPVKIKKSGKRMVLELAANPDILKDAARRKRKNSVAAGFAMETGNLKVNAAEKLRAKGLDIIAANGADTAGSGSIDAVIIPREGRISRTGRVSKRKFAGIFWRQVKKIYAEKNRQ